MLPLQTVTAKLHLISVLSLSMYAFLTLENLTEDFERFKPFIFNTYTAQFEHFQDSNKIFAQAIHIFDTCVHF